MSKVLVLCDGGFKSAFVTGLAVKEVGAENTRLLMINSGQLAAQQQCAAVDRLANHYGLPYACFNGGMLSGGMFELTTHLFTAMSYAGKLGIDKVYYGASKPMDRTEFNYELTHTHLRNMQQLIKCARFENRRANLPEPEAPCMLLNVIQIVMLSRNYGVPLELTWNCDNNGPEPCGKCYKCTRWEIAKRGLIRRKFVKGEKL